MPASKVKREEMPKRKRKRKGRTDDFSSDSSSSDSDSDSGREEKKVTVKEAIPETAPGENSLERGKKSKKQKKQKESKKLKELKKSKKVQREASQTPEPDTECAVESEQQEGQHDPPGKVDFSAWYLRQVTKELEDDLDKIRSAGDFTNFSLPVLITALQQGEAIFTDEEKQRIGRVR